jgi:SAM-dependent methyltransferase
LKLSGAGQVDSPILDVGCDRGEWLELLRENGLAAYGIDINSMMVERTVSLGLDARVADLLGHLRTLSDASRSAITAFHVVEHLPFEVLVDFLDEALRVLLPAACSFLRRRIHAGGSHHVSTTIRRVAIRSLPSHSGSLWSTAATAMSRSCVFIRRQTRSD